MRTAALLVAVISLTGCISSEKVSEDSNHNYALVFKDMSEPKPEILNSRLDRYAKNFGLWKGSERNGEWEFEIFAPQAWVDQVKTGFIPDKSKGFDRQPTVAWWKPDDTFDAYEMPYSSYAAAHLFVEKNPQDRNRIHVFIKRH